MSTDEQMLLNIVRLRYQHSTMFLQVSSVTTQYVLSSNLGVTGSGNVDLPAGGFVPGGTVGGSAGVSVSERPTISYTPLQGAAFVQLLATPLSAEQVILMIETGWPADLVLSMCVRQINDVYAPSSTDAGKDFQRIATLLRTLQDRHELLIERGDVSAPYVVSVRSGPRRVYSPEAIEALDLLGLPSGVDGLPTTNMHHDRPPASVAIRGRSVLGVLFYLSRGVEVPADDDGVYEIAPIPGDEPRLRVLESATVPRDAYVKVRYRGRWFYLEESDSNSKLAFAFLNFIFNTASVPGGGGPVLTVGAGG